MRPITWVVAALQVLSAVGVMILILLQDNKESDGLTVGTASSNNTSGMGMSKQNVLSRLTTILGTILVISTIAVSTMMVIDLK